MSSSKIIAQVHPLVIMNVADHCNRAMYIEPKQSRNLGVLLGKQEGKTIEIINTVEIAFKHELAKIVIDEAFLKRRLDAYKKMFPNLDCLGWYSTGVAQVRDAPEDEDFHLQESISRHCENPIYLIMNVNSEEAKSKK